MSLSRSFRISVIKKWGQLIQIKMWIMPNVRRVVKSAMRGFWRTFCLSVGRETEAGP